MSKNIFCLFIFLLVFCGYSAAQHNPKGENMNNESVSKTVGGLIMLKPEFEERYIILHKYTFPGVLDRIRKSNIRNYSIFLLNGILFSHYEYVGKDFEADMKAIADPVTKDWWKLTDPMQEPLPDRKEGEWWAEMERWLYLRNIIKPSPEAQRIALTAEIKPGNTEAVKQLFTEFPAELEVITNKENFQNNNVYFRDNKVYFYYEYTGSDIRTSFRRLNQNDKFSSFQAELNKLLVPKGNSTWEIMQEVFHTD